ncbi:hypothetical protein BX661DRAFT_203873 [Kickxella alabastrina]|uniref:uncharacterized protein n=1 Tax=Kickxella alabastrina TaxID=61397 RepID=UPI00221EE957|nr:uncharacterized protein BX661DRAFT_203873 [Kickxella alabastrina]KAI7832874.1 hypothetical protein BX661DRAFT_203873 [Kickxella alabastrina]
MKEITSGCWLLTSQQELSPGAVYLNVQIVELSFDYVGIKDGVKSEHVRLQFAKHMHLHNFGDDRVELADMSVLLDALGRKMSDGLKGIEGVGFRMRNTLLCLLFCILAFLFATVKYKIRKALYNKYLQELAGGEMSAYAGRIGSFFHK